MSALSIQVPYQIFADSDGTPLENGYVWIGTTNLDPRTNPVNVYFDAALTQVAPNPLRTVNGYVYNAGSPAQLYIDGVNFSLRVEDKKSVLVYSFPDGSGISPNASGIVYTPAGTGAVATTVENELNALQVSALRFMTLAQKTDVQSGAGSLDVSAAVQLAINYLGTLGGGTLICPHGNYKLGTALVPCNFLTVKGDTATILGGVSPAGTMFIVANSTAAFTAPYVQKLRFENVGFVANGVGVGTAYAYIQTTLTAYSERCEFYNVNVWANMAGGFFGNFILTTWRRCEFGYYSTPVGQFWPIYSKGDIAGNQTNANLVEDCYVLNSLGSYTIYFEAGSDATIRNTRFEHCDAVTTIGFSGVLVTNVEGCYFEDSNGSGTLSLIDYSNDTTNAQGCSSINFFGNYGSLSTNNTHLISHSGASGSISAIGNRFEGLAGKQFVISEFYGNNAPFSAYLGNFTDGFSGCLEGAVQTAGAFSPTVAAYSGTITSYTSSSRWTKIGKLVTLHIDINVASNGTGGALIAVTGFPANIYPDLSGVTSFSATGINRNTGAALSAELLNPGVPTMYVYKYDGTYPVATGQRLEVTVQYIATF